MAASYFDPRASGVDPSPGTRQSHAMQVVTDQIRNYLQYITVQFIEHPERAQLKVAELGPKRLRFKLVLESSDVALLIGRNGFSASAIRGVLKAAAEREGVQVNLQIHSHQEEEELLAREEAED
jgi:predicted RNA-binding protein YlqC (UPF0109 family)